MLKTPNELYVPYAQCNGQSYTPQQWQPKLELQNKSKKTTTDMVLTCPGGCKVTFHKETDYTMQNGTDVHRRAHFAHIGDQGERCLYVQKYKGGGGESEEHRKAKDELCWEPYKKRFCQRCCIPGCDELKDLTHLDAPRVPGYLTGKTEVRLNPDKKWLFDVVLYDYDKIEKVIEVKHTHGTDGEKRKWSIETYGDRYIEVGTNPMDGRAKWWEVIDFHKTYTCQTCQDNWHFTHPECGDEFPECSDSDEKMTNEKDEDERPYVCKYNICVSGGWFTSDGCANRCLCQYDDDDDWDYCGMCPDKYDITLEQIDKWDEVVTILRKDKLIRVRYDGFADAAARSAWMKKWANEWRTSFINETMLKTSPELKYPTGHLKGCHLCIVMYAYPHSINYMMGCTNDNKEVRANFNKKHQTIYDKILQKNIKYGHGMKNGFTYKSMYEMVESTQLPHHLQTFGVLSSNIKYYIETMLREIKHNTV